MSCVLGYFFEWLIFFQPKKLNFSCLESLDFDWVQFTSTVWRLPGSFQWCRANYGEHIARLCQHEAKTNSKLVFLLLVSSPPVWKCIIALAMCSIICIDAMGFCTQTMVFHRQKSQLDTQTGSASLITANASHCASDKTFHTFGSLAEVNLKLDDGDALKNLFVGLDAHSSLSFFHNVTLQSIGTIWTNRFSRYTKKSVRETRYKNWKFIDQQR